MEVLKSEMNWTWTVKLLHKEEGEMNLGLAAQINKLRFRFVKGRRASDRKSNVERFFNIWYCKRFRTTDYYKQNFLSLMYNVSTYIVTNVRLAGFIKRVYHDARSHERQIVTEMFRPFSGPRYIPLIFGCTWRWPKMGVTCGRYVIQFSSVLYNRHKTNCTEATGTDGKYKNYINNEITYKKG